MGPIQATKTCLAKSFQYSGRASLPEYWWSLLTMNVAYLFAMIAFDFLLLGYDSESDDFVYLPFSDTLSLLIYPANLSVTARRLQDCSIPGLPGILPLLVSMPLGFFVVWGDYTTLLEWICLASLCLVVLTMVIAAFPSSPGRNKYGANPNDPNPIEVFR